MPKQVRHNKSVILNSFQNPILDLDIHLTFEICNLDFYQPILSMGQQNSFYSLFRFHRTEGFIRLIQSEGMGDQFFEVLRASHDELKSHVSVTHFTHPDSLESEVFPSDVMKTIEFHLSV